MNGRGKSDSLIVPVKLSNKDSGALASAEEVEGRRLAKGNLYQQTRYRTQCRADLQHELGRIRQAVPTRLYLRQDPSAVVPHAGIWGAAGKAAIQRV